MIHSVDNNSSAQASSARSASGSGSTGGASFADALASAQSASSSASDGTVTGGLQTDLKPPKGETWGPVDGHSDYADILSGARNGFYVSLTGPRRGEAFELVHRHGKTYHVYGEGKHKKWVHVRTDPADLKPPKGETWRAVAHHHDYKKIHGGKRANHYVNLSGNERTGEAFTIAHRGGKTYHVYAGGREVAVGGHQHRHKTDTQDTTGNPSQPG